jgi:hypothetical protein
MAAASDVLLVLFLLVLLRALLRREWLAVAAFVAVFSAATAMTSEYPAWTLSCSRCCGPWRRW